MLLLLALNIVVWLGVLTYSLKLVPALGRRWSLAAVLGGLAAALVLSFGSYQYASRKQVRERAHERYLAGIDELIRGNLQEAEKEFQESLAVQPGNPEAQQALRQVQEQKPAEKREQHKETRVDPSTHGTAPGQGSPAGPAPPPHTTPGSTPPANAPANLPPANAPPRNAPPAKGQPGDKPKPAPHRRSPFEITHYALDVTIDPAAHTLDGTATIRVRSRGGRVPVLEFSLNPEFKPSAAEVDGVGCPLRHSKDLLSLTPRKPLSERGAATVTIQYARAGDTPQVEGGDLISTQGTYLRSEARWYPATGELDFRSPVSVRARVPKGYSVVSVGELKETVKDEKGTLFHWETDRFASMVSLAAAKYVQQSVRVPLPSGESTGQRSELKITCYTFPEHRNRAPAFLKEASAIVRFYQRAFGPYPYEKLAVVEIPLFPGGYGTTSFVMLIDKSFEEKKVDREFLAHEIAHQWWGNSVFPQGLGAAWLTEAFANYSAWMYESSVTGNPRVLQKRVARATSTYFDEVRQKGDQALYDTDPYLQVGATEAILYEKGAVVLHMLRKQIGDKPFLRTLRAFADEHRFGLAKIDDFRKTAEQQSGQQLGWFFDQWLGRTGGMALSYRFETKPDTPIQNLASITVTQGAPAYRAHMKVVLEVENTILNREIELTGQPEQTFTFPIKGRLTNVLFDPDNAILMQPPRWVVPENKASP